MEKELPASVSVGNGLEMGGIISLHSPMAVCVGPPHGKTQSVFVISEPWEMASQCFTLDSASDEL